MFANRGSLNTACVLCGRLNTAFGGLYGIAGDYGLHVVNYNFATISMNSNAIGPRVWLSYGRLSDGLGVTGMLHLITSVAISGVSWVFATDTIYMNTTMISHRAWNAYGNFGFKTDGGLYNEYERWPDSVGAGCATSGKLPISINHS